MFKLTIVVYRVHTNPTPRIAIHLVSPVAKERQTLYKPIKWLSGINLTSHANGPGFASFQSEMNLRIITCNRGKRTVDDGPTLA